MQARYFRKDLRGSNRVTNYPLWDINISNMGNRKFLIKTEYDEKALSEAIESEAKEYDESPLYGCDVSVKEVEE